MSKRFVTASLFALSAMFLPSLALADERPITTLVSEGANVDIREDEDMKALKDARKTPQISSNTDLLKLLGDTAAPISGGDEPPAVVSDDEPPAVVSDDEPPAVVSEDELPAVVSEDELPAVVSKDEPPAVVPDKPTADVPGISPDEFMRMCAGASSEVVLNALENRKADPNARDYYDVTPLMFAAEKNSDPEVIVVLVRFGAKPDAKDKDGKTALMYAAKSNPSPEIISALAANGASVNARDLNRMTALMYAARNNNAATVKALIDAGAEELADKRGWTPLFWAARYTQHPEVIGVLLEAGHDPQVRAHDMATPIDHANRNPRLINTKEFMRLEEESR
ncbi:MAG: ankyrin repeat domain-containing protein [Synergistaceae bacterium]|nr:ankyrin repeat domain-containing protein [Synergistaceae bacterium]